MIQPIKGFLLDIIRMRNVILSLAKRDFQQKYMGSLLGVVWVFLQPLLFISVLYAVFSLGLRVGRNSEIPFSIYLVAGIIAWQYFAGLLISNTGVIKSFSYLVKKVDFRLSILPIVKLLSDLLPHLFLMLVAILLAWFQGYPPGLHTLQFIYYLAAMIILLLGLGWLTSSTSIFVTDVTRLIQISVQFGFWLTPLFWNISMIPERYQWIAHINPLVHITEGYRDALTGLDWFWNKPYEVIYFWVLTFLICLSGMYVYRKLRPHFAEVV